MSCRVPASSRPTSVSPSCETQTHNMISPGKWTFKWQSDDVGNLNGIRDNGGNLNRKSDGVGNLNRKIMMLVI